MANAQQPEIRRSGQSRLVQDSDGPHPPTGGSARREHRTAPPEQRSPYGPAGGRAGTSQEPTGRNAEGD
jgi:hypothetical protein